MSGYHLAQLNIGIVRGPMDSPVMADFAGNLDRLNALADRSPGFVWRLQTDEGNATSIHAFDNPNLLLNMSVWADVESLRKYVFQSAHVEIMRRRREWFEPMDQAFLVLWYVKKGHIPTIPEAVGRLEILRAKGPTAEAFTFRQAFPPPDAAQARPFGFNDECPAT